MQPAKNRLHLSAQGCISAGALSEGFPIIYLDLDVIYVTANGTNTPQCGSEKEPCQTIKYIIETRYKTSSSIKILVMSNIKESNRIYIQHSRSIFIKGQLKNTSIDITDDRLFDGWYCPGCNVSLSFRNIGIRNNGAAFISVNSVNRLEVIIKNMSFEGTSGKPRFVFYLDNAAELTVTVNDCTFKDMNTYVLFQVKTNYKYFFSLKNAFFYDNQFHNLLYFNITEQSSNADIQIINCTFSNNGFKQNLLFLDGGTAGGDASVLFKNTTFTENKVGDNNGLIMMTKERSKTLATNFWKLVLNDVVADRNNGSVVHLQFQNRYTKTRKTEIEARITKCTFTKNNAFSRGGAIIADTTSDSSTIKLVVHSSRFIKNSAASGGAISSNSYTIISQSEFILNHANNGGAIKLWTSSGVVKRTDTADPDYSKLVINEISDSTFVTDVNALDTSANLNIANLSLKLLDLRGQVISTEVLTHESSSLLLEATGNISFNCGLGRNVKIKTLRAKYGERRSKEATGTVSKFYAYISVTCLSCPKDWYNIQNGISSWNMSTGNMANSSTENKCFNCPRGGNCTAGYLGSRRGNWGYKKKRRAEVAFVPCPNGYCDQASRSYSGCTDTRHGVLCGSCNANTNLGVFSSTCVKASSCDFSFNYYSLALFPIVLILFVTSIVFSKRWKKLEKHLKAILGSLKRFAKRYYIKFCKKIPSETEMEDEPFTEEDDGTSSNSSSLKQFLVILSFYQIQSLIYIPSQVLPDTLIACVWRNLQKYLGMISMMNFNGNGESGDEIQYCFPAFFTFVHRTVLNLFINASPILLLVIVLLIAYFVERLYGMKMTFKLQAQTAVVNLITIFYIPIAKNLFRLVKCVGIVQNDEERKVLFEQGTIDCYQPWQVVIIVFICVVLIWYFAFLYVGSLYLRQQRYKEFFVMSALPISSIYYFIKLKYESRNTQTELGFSTASGVLVVSEERGIEMEEIVNKDEMVEESKVEINDYFDATGKEKKNTRSDDLLEVLQGHCKIIYWPSIKMLQKLFIVLMPVLFEYNYRQVLGLIVVLLLYLIFLVHKKPYTDPIMNILEPMLISMLLFLGVCGIVNTAYVTSSDDNIKSTLVIIDYIKFALLLLPIPLWIFCIIKHNYSQPDSDAMQNQSLNIKYASEASMETCTLIASTGAIQCEEVSERIEEATSVEQARNDISTISETIEEREIEMVA